MSQFHLIFLKCLCLISNDIKKCLDPIWQHQFYVHSQTSQKVGHRKSGWFICRSSDLQHQIISWSPNTRRTYESSMLRAAHISIICFSNTARTPPLPLQLACPCCRLHICSQCGLCVSGILEVSGDHLIQFVSLWQVNPPGWTLSKSL